MVRVLTLMLVLFLSLGAQAEKVEFPEEELATESVLPVFDQPSAVKKKNVSLARHLELGGFAGAGLNEAFFDMTLFGVAATYNFTDMSAAQVIASFISAKPSQFVPQLNSVGTTELNLQYLPQPKWYALLVYRFTPYYGKMSITKQAVINNSLYMTGGVGMVNINNEENSPALVGGLGQNFYFGPRWGLNLDFRGLLFQSPDPLSTGMSADTKTVSVSRFRKQTNFNIAITLGLIVML